MCDLFGAELVGSRPPPVFEQVITVGRLEDSQNLAGRPRSAAAIGVEKPRNLKVDQIGSPVITQEDILTLFQIDVGHLQAVNLIHHRGQSREEFVIQDVVTLQGMAGDKLVDEAGFTPGTTKSRDPGNGLRASQQPCFAAHEKPPDPGQGKAEEVCLALHFQDNLACRPGIGGCRGEEIVLVGSGVSVVPAVDGDLRGEIPSPEGPQPCGGAL